MPYLELCICIKHFPLSTEVNPFISEFGHIHCCKIGVSVINQDHNGSVDPDEMAHYKPSTLHPHCSQKHLCRSLGLKELKLE